MILVLKTADFSNSNIGQIELPHELSEFTIEFLSHYNKELTTLQTYAVDDFLNNMRNSGIWDKLAFIYFPCLAANMNEAFYDPTGNTYLPESYKGYAIINGGLVADKNGWTEGELWHGCRVRLKQNTDIDAYTQGYHYAALSTNNSLYGNILMSSFVHTAYPALYANNALVYYQKIQPSFTDEYINRQTTLRISNLEAPVSGVVPSADKSFFMSNGILAQKSGITADSVVFATNNEVYGFLQPLCNGDSSQTTSDYKNLDDVIYLWSAGKALTKQEAILYSQYCNTFANAMGII